VTASTDIFDPKTKTFSAGPNMATERAFQTATLLPDGTVLIAGGEDQAGAALASTEIFDPVKNTFTAGPNMQVARLAHTATPMPYGEVLLAGGTDGKMVTGFTQSEIYNTRTRSFVDGIVNMAEGRYGQLAGLLSDGQILLAGGVNQVHKPVTSAEIFNASQYNLYETGNLDVGRQFAVGALLSTGKFLLAGGSADTTSASLFDQNSGGFTPTGQTSELHTDHPAGLLVQNTNTAMDGKFLIVGGVDPAAGAGATMLEAYDPISGSWSSAGQTTQPRVGASATAVGGQ
jgi:Galactose oxidase, central domain